MAYDDEQILSKIEQTFSQGPFASEYLQRLQALDSKNVFQQTQGVFFLSQYTEEPVRYHLSRGPVTNVGVAGAFAGAALIISVSAYIIHGGKTAKTSADKRQPKRQNSKEKEVPAKFGSKNEEQFESIAL